VTSGVSPDRAGNAADECVTPASVASAAIRSASSEPVERAALRPSGCSAEDSNRCIPQIDIESVSAGDEQQRQGLQRKLRQDLGRFRACYEDELRSNPWLAARWSTSVRVGRSGAICEVRTLSKSVSGSFAACLERALRSAWPGFTNPTEVVSFELIFFTRARQLPTSGRL